MRKTVGVLTEDFRLYHDLVGALKAREVPFVSLSFTKRIPQNVGAVLTSAPEAPRIRFPHVLVVNDIDSAIARAVQTVKGKEAWRELAIGIDPGRKPGVAVVGDGDVVDTRIAPSPEAVASLVRDAQLSFPAEVVRVRVGHGDPTNRNRILNALARDPVRVEIVNEAGTTRRGPQPDVDAAIRIALTPGTRIEPPLEIHLTQGEVREIQRRSRIDSGGQITISATLAGAVARGEMSLPQAISLQRKRDRPS